MRATRTRRSLTMLAALMAFSVLVGEAAPPVASIEGAAVGTQQASIVAPWGDVVSVYQTGQMTTLIRDAALGAAYDAGAPAVAGRGFTIGLTRVRRGNTVIQQASGAGWAFPMGVTALPPEAIAAVMGRVNSGVIGAGQIVMGQTSAGLRGAQVGDTVDLLAANGSIRTFTIGRIAPDAEVGGTEIVMSLAQADLLGATLTTRVLIYGQFSRSALDTALANRGLSGSANVRIRRSWDAFDPDLTLGIAETKALLGEFDYYYAGLTDLGYTAMNAAWVSANLPSGKRSYPGGISAKCHNGVHADLTAALAEVASTYPGLIDGGAYSSSYGNDPIGSRIFVTNANKFGGCATGSVRFARITQNLGSVSRHSWGMALDFSTVSNCQGCAPRLDCRVVRIFRKHNFAWGGNFLTPDGMHMEWVGEARNTQQYPSKYCPNVPSGNPENRSAVDSLAVQETFFADDGWMLEPEHDHG